MSTLTLTLPIETQTESNAKGHWRPKAKRAAHQRSLTVLLTMPLVAKVRRQLLKDSVSSVTVTLTRISPLELDDDNLSSAFKHVRDGVADALGIDDRDRRVQWLYAQTKGAVRERAVHLEVRIGDRGRDEAFLAMPLKRSSAGCTCGGHFYHHARAQWFKLTRTGATPLAKAPACLRARQ